MPTLPPSWQLRKWHARARSAAVLPAQKQKKLLESHQLTGSGRRAYWPQSAQQLQPSNARLYIIGAVPQCTGGLCIPKAMHAQPSWIMLRSQFCSFSVQVMLAIKARNEPFTQIHSLIVCSFCSPLMYSHVDSTIGVLGPVWPLNEENMAAHFLPAKEKHGKCKNKVTWDETKTVIGWKWQQPITDKCT